MSNKILVQGALMACAAASLLSAASAKAQVNTRLALTRQLSNGNYDTNFDGDGGRVFDLPNSGEEHIYAVKISGNKIVAAGGSETASNRVLLVTRFNTNGSFDTTFGGGDGIVTTDITGTTWESANALAIDAGGRIVVAGPRNNDLTVVRYNTNGSPDTTFTGTGIFVAGWANFTTFATGVAIQSDGKIVVVGGRKNASGEGFMAMRINTNGTLDTTFGSGGGTVQSVCSGFGGSAGGVAIDSNGKIIAAGECLSGTLGVMRLTTSGALDTTFSSDGKATPLPSGSTNSDFGGVAVDSANRVYVAGASDDKLMLGRILTNGNMDTTLGGDGFMVTNLTDRDFENWNAITLSGSKIVVAGQAVDSTNGGLFMTGRYNTDGSFDTTFSGNGRSFYNFSSLGWESARSVAVDASGNVVSGGHGGP